VVWRSAFDTGGLLYTYLRSGELTKNGCRKVALGFWLFEGGEDRPWVVMEFN
jgi:hypothetical protein